MRSSWDPKVYIFLNRFIVIENTTSWIAINISSDVKTHYVYMRLSVDYDFTDTWYDNVHSSDPKASVQLVRQNSTVYQ